MRIKVLDEIGYERFKDLSVEETAALVRKRIIEEVDEHRETEHPISDSG